MRHRVLAGDERPHAPMYLSPTSSSMLQYAKCYGNLANPNAWGKVRYGIVEGRWWAADNGAFSKRFDAERFFAWLDAHKPYARRCLFVAAPDSVGCCSTTRELWQQHGQDLLATGLPVAYVAQDGMPISDVPDECEALFIGGSDDYKLGRQAELAIEFAISAGLWVHVGRVNSARRIRRFASQGVHSVDGTCQKYCGYSDMDQRFRAALNEQYLEM